MKIIAHVHETDVVTPIESITFNSNGEYDSITTVSGYTTKDFGIIESTRIFDIDKKTIYNGSILRSTNTKTSYYVSYNDGKYVLVPHDGDINKILNSPLTAHGVKELKLVVEGHILSGEDDLYFDIKSDYKTLKNDDFRYDAKIAFIKLNKSDKFFIEYNKKAISKSFEGKQQAIDAFKKKQMEGHLSSKIKLEDKTTGLAVQIIKVISKNRYSAHINGKYIIKGCIDQEELERKIEDYRKQNTKYDFVEIINNISE